MANITLAAGSVASIEIETIYSLPISATSANILPLLIVNRSQSELSIRVYWDDSATTGGAQIIIPAGDGRWRHMVGIPMGMSTGESISIQCATDDPFDYRLDGSLV